MERRADGELLSNLHLGRNVVMRYYACMLVFLFALGGCAGTCANSGVEGSYELNVRGVNYGLQLRPEGQGALSVSGKPVGNLHWALDSTSDQQILELNAANEVYAALSGIAPRRGGGAGTLVVSKGVFAPAPECSRKGRMLKLVLDYDERIEFHRIGD
jgi:hypothetical protein